MNRCTNGDRNAAGRSNVLYKSSFKFKFGYTVQLNSNAWALVKRDEEVYRTEKRFKKTEREREREREKGEYIQTTATIRLPIWRGTNDDSLDPHQHYQW